MSQSDTNKYRANEFDWRHFVALNKPGIDTEEAQERLRSLTKLTADLTDWAVAHKLSSSHRIRASAYTGIYSTSLPIPYEQALLAAKYTLWLFVFDGYIDKLNYAQFQPEQREPKLAFLDFHLSPILGALHRRGLTLEQASTYSLPLSLFGSDRDQISKNEDTFPSLNPGFHLGAAISDISQTLQEISQRYDDHVKTFLLKTFINETAAVVGAMRGELDQSFRYLAGGKLPGLEDYLENSLFSICLRAAGTIALFFELENDPTLVWGKWLSAINVGAKALRMANDCANVMSELEERKVNSLTIALSRSGHAPMGPYQQESQELVEARALIRTYLNDEVLQFSQLSANLPQGPLAYYVYSSIAFTLAMYEAGDYAEPN